MVSPVEAAQMCGLSYAGYKAAVAKGILPGCVPGMRRVSVKRLEAAIDALYGVDTQAKQKLNSETHFDFHAAMSKAKRCN